MTDDPHCPLCGAGPAAPFHRDRQRGYLRCAVCELVFVPEWEHVSPEHEKWRYDQHRNRPDDPGYRRFLARLADAVVPRLSVNATGLDFGCGPCPLLAQLFEERGFAMSSYDPHYADNPLLLDRTYDFVVCSETVEHFRAPAAAWDGLTQLVGPGGLLGIMTERTDSLWDFGRWHYITDETHVAFYADSTFRWLAARHGFNVEFPGPTLALFTRPVGPADVARQNGHSEPV